MMSFRNILPTFLVIGFLTFVTLFVFRVNEALKKEHVSAHINQMTQEFLSGAKMTIGDINVSRTTQARITLYDVSLKDRFNENILTSREISFRIPYYVLLGGDGRVEVDFKNSTFIYSSFRNSLKQEIDDFTPESFNAQRVTLRAYDLDFYISKNSRKFSLDRSVLRNLSMNMMSALEVDTRFSLTVPPGKKLEMQGVFVTEFYPRDLLAQGLLKSDFFFRVNHLQTIFGDEVLSRRAFRQLRAVGSMKASSLQSLAGHVRISENENYFNAEFEVADDLLSLSEIESKIALTVLENLGLYQFKDYSVHGASIEFTGGAGINRDLKIFPELNFLIDQNIELKIAGTTLSNSVRGRIGPSVIWADLRSSLYGGQIHYSVHADHTFYLYDWTYHQLQDAHVQVLIQDINLRNTRLRSQSLFNSLRSIYRGVTDQSIPISLLEFEVKNLTDQEDELSGQGYFKQKRDQTEFAFDAHFRDGHLSAAVERRAEDFQGSLKAQDFEVLGMYIFLPVRYWQYQGPLNSVLELKWRDGEMLETLEGDVRLTLRNGQLPFDSIFPKLDQSIPDIFRQDQSYSAILSSFDLFDLNAQLRGGVINIQELQYLTSQEQLKLLVRGQVGLSEQESEVTIMVHDKANIFFTEESDLSTIPLRFSGKGIKLRPDLLYTIKNMRRQ